MTERDVTTATITRIEHHTWRRTPQEQCHRVDDTRAS
jgi:hypothetical protein